MQGAIAATILSSYSFLATVFLLQFTSIIDCLLYGFAAWRIYKMSRVWALLGFLGFLAGVTSDAMMTRGKWTLAVLFFIVPILNGVRGTFAFQSGRRRAAENSDSPTRTESYQLRGGAWPAVACVGALAVGIGMYSAHISGHAANNGDDHVKLWDRNDCLTKTFPRFRDTDFMKRLASDELGQLRIVSAKMYCARQWDAAKFAAGADLLESNGLLFSQTPLVRRFSQQTGNHPEAMYSSFPKEVADFLKVFDSGIFLLPSGEEIEKLSKTDPNLPNIQTIGQVRSKLNIDSLWTVPSQLPQEYQVSLSPDIKLVTTVGLDTTLWQLWNTAATDVFLTKERRVLLSETVARAEGDGTNLFADQLGGVLGLYLGLRDDLEARVQSKPFRDLDALPKLRILFLPKKDIPDLPNDRVAVYFPGKILMEATPETNPVMPNSGDNNDPHLIASRIIPAPLNHEIYHYLFFRKAVAQSGFILEGEATANGEYISQMVYEGAYANPENKADQLAQMTLDLLKARGSAPANFDWDLYNRLGLAREQSSPLTNVQCRLLTVLRTAYLEKTGPMPLASQLTLDPKLFQSQGESVELAYAQAWAVYHVDITRSHSFHEKLEQIFPKVQQSGVASLNEGERRDLDVISTATLAWVNSGTQSGCVAGGPNDQIAGKVD